MVVIVGVFVSTYKDLMVLAYGINVIDLLPIFLMSGNHKKKLVYNYPF